MATKRPRRRLTLGIGLLVVAVVAFPFLWRGRGHHEFVVLGEDSSNLAAYKRALTDLPLPIAVRVQAEDFEQLQEKANRDLAAGTGLYDLILQYNFALANYVRHRRILDLDTLVSKDTNAELDGIGPTLFQNHWEEVGYYYADPDDPSKGAKPFGLPFAANSMLLVYNRAFFDNTDLQAEYLAQYGAPLAPPTTWPEFRRMAEFFTSAERGTSGVCLQGAAGGWLYYEWCNFLFGMGGQVMPKDRGWKGDSKTPIMLNTGSAIDAAALYLELKPFNAGDFFSIGAAEQRELLLQGKVAMAIVWSDYVFDLVERARERGLSFGFAPIPGSVSMLAGGAFYVNRDSRHPDFAASAIAYLLNPRRQAKLIEEGLCSPVREAYTTVDREVVPYADALKDSLDRGVYMLEAGPDADLIAQEITKALQSAWRGELTAAQAMQRAQDEIVRQRPAVWAQLGSEGAK